MGVSLLLCSSLAVALGTARPQAPETAVDWNADVRPILAEHCLVCHGPDPEARAAGVRLDTAEGLFHGGPDAPVVPGDPDGSELVYRVAADDDFERMPPPGTGERLTPEEIATLRAWIEQGAEWTPHWAYAPFGEPCEPPEPVIDDGRERTPIDTFLRRRLLAQGLDLAEDAPLRDQVRRLYLDLTGLPPAHHVVTDLERRVASDGSGDAAWGELVDRVLASRAHAEHYAVRWLDVARYADSHGFTTDGARSMWPWRDWVVRAIEEDMPFDRFTIEQLAGDLLPGATRDQRLATGFHRNTQINGEGGAKDEENRVAAVMDRVATTGAVWLGTTLACAQCHTHKFDPVTHTDYFRMFAVFNSTRDSGVSAAPRMLVGLTSEESAGATAHEERLAEAELAHREAWAASSAGWTPWQPARATGSNGPELRPTEFMGAYRVVGQNAVFSTYVLEGEVQGPRTVGALRLEVLPDGGPGRARNRNFVLQEVRVASRPAADPDAPWTRHPLAPDARADFEQDTRGDGGGLYRAAFAADDDPATPGWAVKPAFDTPHAAVFPLASPVDLDGRTLRIELVQEHGGNHTIGAFRVCLGEGRDGALVTTRWRDAWAALGQVRRSRPDLPTSLVMEERATPRSTRRFHRGSFLDPREVVRSGVPPALDLFTGGTSEVRTRLDLARWLVHPDNALVHRVTVNRWWQQLFGRGLVPTENDLGLRGARPSHPELLEWLARGHVASGFSRRAFLRLALTSTAYRQGRRNPAAEERDPENVLLGRRLPRRLSGEALRDCMLAAAGMLTTTGPGEPPVQPVRPAASGAFTQNPKSTRPSEGEARFRRSLYTRTWRSSPFPFYQTFDAPVRDVSCTRRTPSATALQALALANDPIVMEAARGLGALLRESSGEGEGARARMIEAAWTRALARRPSPDEVARVRDHLSRIQEHDGVDAVPAALARLVFNLAEFTYTP